MQDGDFSLPIVVVLPERRIVADEHAATTPFIRAPLPGVDPRPARSRPVGAPLERAPLPPARHAWPSSPTRAAVPSRLKARSILAAAPPPATRAVPLSDDDGKRMERRVRAYRRQAWAQRMLERFQFDAG